jgi:hypothetical protein
VRTSTGAARVFPPQNLSRARLFADRREPPPALADRGERPVVVMVPSSLHEKWPRDFDVFRAHVARGL